MSTETAAVERSRGLVARLRDSPRAGWWAFLLAVAAALAAGLVKRAALDRGLDPSSLLYFPAIALAAWFGGQRAGLVATIAAVIFDLIAFASQPGQVSPARTQDVERAILFILAGTSISILTGRLRASVTAGARLQEVQHGTLQAEREARAQAEESAHQAAAVVSIGTHALSGIAVPRLMQEASEVVGATLGAPIVSVTNLDESGKQLRKVAGVGWPPGVIGSARVPLGRDSHAGFTLGSDSPVVVDDFATDTRFTVSPLLRGLSPISGIGVRIGDPKQPYGVLGAYTPERREFSQRDVDFVQSVANVLGAAIARAEAVEELARSREQLDAVLESVGDAITVQRTDGTLVYANQEAARMTGFASAEELIATPVGSVRERFEIVEADGTALALEDLPGRRALQGERVAERLVRFRLLATGVERWSMVAATPVMDQRGQVRFAINIFRDVTDSKRREDAERFLADATAALATSLDERASVRMLADLAIERLADWCAVDVVAEEGPVDFAIAHADPAKRELGRRMRNRFPFDLDTRSGPGNVMRTGQPELVSDLQAVLEGVGPEVAELIRSFDLRSYLCVPLVSRGRPIGVISMLTEGSSGRRYDQNDLEVALELGQRAGATVEQARFFRDADARRAELTAVLTAMGEAVMLFDAEGELQLNNPAAAELFNARVPQSLTELRDVLPPSSEDGHWDPADQGEPHEVRHADGRWLEISTYHTAVGSREGEDVSAAAVRGSTILVVRDVTASRQAQAAREAFIGLLSHELRTPITTIYGGTRLLDRPLQEEQRKELVRDVRLESERLYRLVEDLLVMTRVERGGVEIGDEPLLLQRIVGSIVATEEARWPGLTVNVSLPGHLPAVRGELTYVEQIVRNLLTNAAKYGGIDQPIDLVAGESGAEVIVKVMDRGPGISDQDAERLFDLFYRGAATAAVASGAGIGLFVCRALVTAMGGRMWAAARDGGGAEFCFSLPVLEVDEPL